MAESTSVPETEYVRLHVTPLTSELLPSILPASIVANARNISYHTLQSFPERAYGYVELPTMDAEKIKKKLNGAILKGTKVKIEVAKPKKEIVLEEEESISKPKRDKSSRKRKRDEIPAAEIGDRSVKRGWSVPVAPISKKGKDKDKEKEKEAKKVVIKSKYTSGPECLFKTVLPANVAGNTGKERKTDTDKKRTRGVKEVVVHEFSKTTKYATFLRDPAQSSKKKTVAEYVEGKGWVDKEGTVVEQVSIKSKRPQKALGVELKIDESTSSEAEMEELQSSKNGEDERAVSEIGKVQKLIKTAFSTSSSGSSSEEDSDSESSSDDDLDENRGEKPESSKPLEIQSELPAKDASSTSSSGSSSEEDSDSNSSSDDDLDAAVSEKELESPKASRPQSSAELGLTIKIPNSGITTTPIDSQVHPLEALYKRPRFTADNPLPQTNVPSFSFFDADADNEDIEEESQDRAPLTPYTHRDFEFRGIRSAAPTPDTAHANKRFTWPTENNDDDADEEESYSPSQKASAIEGKSDVNAESDFQKWFYENRGETNRAWKKRRKMVAKEKRQRENRKRNDRAV
jgi:hypothetical protein